MCRSLPNWLPINAESTTARVPADGRKKRCFWPRPTEPQPHGKGAVPAAPIAGDSWVPPLGQNASATLAVLQPWVRATGPADGRLWELRLFVRAQLGLALAETVGIAGAVLRMHFAPGVAPGNPPPAQPQRRTPWCLFCGAGCRGGGTRLVKRAEKPRWKAGLSAFPARRRGRSVGSTLFGGLQARAKCGMARGVPVSPFRRGAWRVLSILL